MSPVPMSSSWKSIASLCCGLLLASLAAPAQTPPAGDALRVLSSATFQDPATSKNFAYLLWQAEDPALLRGATYAVWLKPGTAASAAPYTRVSTVALQTRASILATIVDSMPAALGDAATLGAALDELLGSLVPAAELPLGDKLSAAMQAAQNDPAIHQRLTLLSRGQPILAVCMGIAAVVELPATVTTIEFRTQAGGGGDPSAPFDRVAGRVTIDLASPPPIPAPGPPVHVPDTAPSGHLNAKLRWGVPNPLRRASPLTFGYNVYRMNKAFAEAGGHHTTPPTPAALAALLASNPTEVTQVNEFAVMPVKLFTPAEAANLASDAATHFVVDDNGALSDGGTPFADGDQFYYFTAARDLLGRPGQLSQAALVTICDRMPPLPPVRVKVANERNAAAGRTFLQVAWSPNPSASEEPDHYLVFRWLNPAEMTAANTPAEYAPHQVGAPVPHVPGTTRYTFTDSGAGAPADPADLNKTFWYSVRAVKSTACGNLASGNSAPGFGVLRDRSGPLGGGATITLRRYCPEVVFESYNIVSLTPQLDDLFTGPRGNVRHVEADLLRIDPRIEGAAVYLCYEDPNGDTPNRYILLDRKRFQAGDDRLIVRKRIPAAAFNQGAGVSLLVCAQDINGKLDYRKIALNNINPDNGNIASLDFLLRIEEQVKTITGGGVGRDSIHTAVVPGSADTSPIEIEFTPTPGTREYKLYKRIDGGELILLDQAEYDPASGPTVAISDSELPANCATVCYFIQFFDEHGNPGPLSDLGCVTTTSKVDLPVPLLANPERGGTQTAPTATLNWFCEETGVERFRIYISDGDSPVATAFSGELSPVLIPVIPLPGPGSIGPRETTTAPGVVIDGETYQVYETGRVGGNFGDPAKPGSFSLDLNVQSGREYTFFVRAVNKAGDEGESSNLVTFTWSQAAAASGPQVPWPARGLPTVDPDFIDEIEAQYLPNLHGGTAGVRIGELKTPVNYDVDIGFLQRDGQTILRNATNWPATSGYSLDLYQSDGGETALSFALYRYQVVNEYFPTVSGDITQVTPLIDRVRTQTTGGGSPRTELVDPFLEIQPDPSNASRLGLYVRDTQGVVRGGTYVYLLVRFKANGEIDRTIPTNPVQIPF